MKYNGKNDELKEEENAFVVAQFSMVSWTLWIVRLLLFFARNTTLLNSFGISFELLLVIQSFQEFCKWKVENVSLSLISPFSIQSFILSARHEHSIIEKHFRIQFTLQPRA